MNNPNNHHMSYLIIFCHWIKGDPPHLLTAVIFKRSQSHKCHCYHASCLHRQTGSEDLREIPCSCHGSDKFYLCCSQCKSKVITPATEEKWKKLHYGKCSNIVHIPKSSHKALACNYHPISLLFYCYQNS